LGQQTSPFCSPVPVWRSGELTCLAK
jgi:hypothetical protein